MALAKEERYTYADYLEWDENERIELIYGAPVMMAPPSRIAFFSASLSYRFLLPL